MNAEERLKAAGFRPTCDRKWPWTRDGQVWFAEDEALVVVLTAERDAAIARAEAAEALAASRPDVSPELAFAWLCELPGGPSTSAIHAALRAHAAKVSR